MYVIIKADGSAYHLKNNQTYIIGRRDADIALNDLAVSRNHAEISVRDGKVLLKEIKASNKTYLNGTQLQSGVQVEVELGSEIRFGNKESIYILQRDKLIVTTSGLHAEEKIVLNSIIKEFNGTMTSKWSPQCTHVVVDSFLVTIKVLCALITKTPIVTLEYFKKRLKEMQQNKILPNIKDFQPETMECKLQRNQRIDYNLDRRRLFKNKIFVFETDNSRNKMGDVIRLAGGTAETYDPNKIKMEDFLRSTPEYIIVVEKDLEGNSDFHKCIQYIMGKKRRAIPLTEIAHAIQICDCSTDCNPNFSRIEHLLSGERIIHKSEVLVPETDTLSASIRNTESNEVISESQLTDSNMHFVPSSTPKIDAKTMDFDAILIENKEEQKKRKTSSQSSQKAKKQKSTLSDFFSKEDKKVEEFTSSQNISLTGERKRKLLDDESTATSKSVVQESLKKVRLEDEKSPFKLNKIKEKEEKTPKLMMRKEEDTNKEEARIFTFNKLNSRSRENEDSEEHVQKKTKEDKENSELSTLKNKKSNECTGKSPKKEIVKSSSQSKASEPDEYDSATREYIESLKFNIIVLPDESFIRKDFADISIAPSDNSISNLCNYKKFKPKVVQRQTKIVSSAQMKDYVCNGGDLSFSEESEDEVDEASLNIPTPRTVSEKNFKFKF